MTDELYLAYDGELLKFTPIGYQGPAQHTYTTACDGFHEPGQCPRTDTDPAGACR